MRITKQDLKIYIYPNKTWGIRWLKTHTFHREDGPASVWSDGAEYYHLNGELYFKDEKSP